MSILEIGVWAALYGVMAFVLGCYVGRYLKEDLAEVTAPYEPAVSLETERAIYAAMHELTTLPERRRIAGLIDRGVVIPMPKREM